MGKSEGEPGARNGSGVSCRGLVAVVENGLRLGRSDGLSGNHFAPLGHFLVVIPPVEDVPLLTAFGDIALLAFDLPPSFDVDDLVVLERGERSELPTYFRDFPTNRALKQGELPKR